MNPEEAWRFLKMAKEEKFFKAGNVFITINYVNYGKRVERDSDHPRDFTGDPHDSVLAECKIVIN